MKRAGARGGPTKQLNHVTSRTFLPFALLFLSSTRDHRMAKSVLICETDPWKDLKAHVEDIKKTHLRELMSNTERCKSMTAEFDGILLDYSRQCATLDTLNKLNNLAEAARLKEKIDQMFKGERDKHHRKQICTVLHVALPVINSDGKNVIPDVWQVLDKIKDLSDRVRNGAWVGGKVLENVIAVGIGGSFLGPLFVHTALQTDPEAAEFAIGRKLHLIVVVSTTFTTVETMLNARTLREWISAALGYGYEGASTSVRTTVRRMEDSLL
ncbi:hypothetical protein OROMI_013663 [Orobanche minor]